MELNKILQGDCLEVLKTLPENSVDSIVTDPPYELGFMGKSWDNTGIANNPLMWAECLRVLKPGGYLLSFGGTRTYHRMACAIEDAGFEVRDMIEWVYGSGFPKSLSVGKAINSLETKEWSKISNAIDKIDKNSIIEVWKNNVSLVVEPLEKKITEVGNNTQKNFFVPDTAVLLIRQENNNVSVTTVEMYYGDQNLLSVENPIIAIGSAEQNIKLLPNLVRFAEKLPQNQNLKPLNIFTAECDVREWLKENTKVNHKVDEVLKTLRGNKKYSNEEIINVLCVVITEILKHIILNQSKTFQNLDTKSQMECAFVINAIITGYTAENLILNTVNILKSKAVYKLQGNEREKFERDNGSATSIEGKKTIYGSGENKSENGTRKFIDTKGTSEWEGWGTALKPAHEPICMARKPLSTGGLDIAKTICYTIREKGLL